MRPLLCLALLLCAAPAQAQIPRLERVIVVVMENQDYGAVKDQPYIANFIAQGSVCGDAHGVARPSQPNYLAMWAGTTHGVTSNDCPAPGSPYLAENLGHAIEAAGLRWRAYSESLPAAGSPACSWDGSLYTRKHCPWTNYGNLDHDNERPYSDLAQDLANDSLPNLAFIVPNNCHNTHDCSIPQGDAWLASNVPPLLGAVGPNGVVVITYDEGSLSNSANHILTVFRGAPVKQGFTLTRRVDHYNFLRTLCEALGVAPFGIAADSSAISDIWAPVLAVGDPVRPGASLEPVRPNPSSGPIRALLRLPSPARVRAEVFSVAGRRVATIFEGAAAGDLELRWSGRQSRGESVPLGVYYLRVTAGERMLARRFALVR